MEAWLRELGGWEAAALFGAENLLILAAALAAGHLMIALFRTRRITGEPAPLEIGEIALASSTIILNTAVTWAGWWLWREGWLVLRWGAWWEVALDLAVIFLVMDAAMYGLHRLAHHRLLFGLLHRAHHRYERPRPLTLFALNPAEAVSFGGLWLGLLLVWDATWQGIGIYLTLNVIFGLVGHLGVEPLPRRWQGAPGVRLLGTSTFHAVHHDDFNRNYGFYTSIWDRIFKTHSTAQVTRSFKEGADEA